jgi:hypothetical protein
VGRYRLGWLAAVVSASVLVWAQPALGSCGSWQKVSGAHVRGDFSDVSASSATDAWAVGHLGDSLARTLVERWNGSVWRRVASPNPGRVTNNLSAVVAIAPDDVWAVGVFGTRRTALVLHWDGSEWHRQQLPSNARHADLRDIAAVSATDVWAVGSNGASTKTRTLHYNGSSWKVVPSISAPSHGGFSGVTATSPTDVWAVGNVLIEHWDGHVWSRLTSPGAGHSRNLTSVTAISLSDAVAVDAGRGAIDHWDGTSWTTAATPPSPFDGISAIAASGPTDAWAVGTNDSQTTRIDPEQQTVDHWDGTVLTGGVLPLVLPAGLVSVANVPATTTYWAVGFTSHLGGPTFYATPRIEFHC